MDGVTILVVLSAIPDNGKPMAQVANIAKKLILVLIFLATCSVPAGFYIYGITGSDYVNEIDHKRSISTPTIRPGFALVVVALMFGLTLGVLWALSKIGGPLKADVNGTISKFGGKITVTAAGIVGAFLAIFIVGVSAVYLLSR